MSDRIGQDDLARYRAGYLKMKSVLQDGVAELPVYTLLIDSLRTLLDDRRQIGVLHIGIGSLDLVESLYGWQVLDRILGRVSTILRGRVGEILPADSLLAVNNVAGDRFLVFIPETTEGGQVDGSYLARLGKDLEDYLGEAFDTDDFAGLNPRLDFRSGHAILSENPYFRFERRVHAAIEEARSLPGRMARRREVSSSEELKRIVSESAVSTVYHPVVDLGNDAVIGYEALTRGPEGSMFEMPYSMFALSGQAGVETALDRLCRTEALRNAHLPAGKAKLFINVLTGTLTDPDWLNGNVKSLLRDASLTPADLVLEISERDADDHADVTGAALQQLRGEGFGIALDDAGTGYSSLATMERVRPDFVKVDSTLVRGIEANLIQQEAFRSLVRIAARLGADVVAEGVETDDEVSALIEIGVRYGQGFLFSRPAPLTGDAIPVRPGTIDH